MSVNSKIIRDTIPEEGLGAVFNDLEMPEDIWIIANNMSDYS
jgi:hypothetical protein